MPTAEKAKLQVEAGQTLVEFVALTDQGAHTDFRSTATLWSDRSGYSPTIRPNGLEAGGLITTADSGSSNVVDVAALTYFLAGGSDGTAESVAASADVTVYRAQSAGTHIINSVTVNSAGAIAVVRGTSSGSSSFSTTRGATGGPPWIPTTSIEIGQVRFTSSAAAVVASSEIYQVIGTHVEQWNYPMWTVKHANISNQVLGYAGIVMDDALPLIHSDNAGAATAAKKVYAKYYTPTMTEVARATDFQPADQSASVSSAQVYNDTLNAVSKSLGQGQFTVYGSDNTTDLLARLGEEAAKLWFRFYPDRTKSPYILTQGILAITRPFPAGANISMSCTISPETKSQGVAV